VDGAVAGRAMLLAPAVAVIPGGAAWLAIAVACQTGLSAAVAAVIGVGMLALTTRGLHLDGLADTADGFAASYQRERALAVMRSGDTGPAGLATVVLVLLLQVSGLAQALHLGQSQSAGGASAVWQAGGTVLIAAIAGRAGVVLACRRGIPAARPEGLGATVAGSVSLPGLVLTMAAATAACAGLAVVTGPSWQAGAVAAVASLVTCAVLVRRAVRRFGGITGDVIGACVEAGTAAAILVLAAA
jgi:adenosylcobinamide-GDP ribazoletransferase